MASKTLIDLVLKILPDSLFPDEFFSEVAVPESWLKRKPRLACAYILRKHPRINWKAYLDKNPDVKAAKMDPCLHFIKHGLFEGRQLIANEKHKLLPLNNDPLVSIIVINYNNSVWLERCIESLINQSLYQIEIIVVDDGSTDESLKILDRYSQKDDRIVIIRHLANQGLALSRKSGVINATSPYIMFLDADDSYVHNACEIAYNAIVKGYDIVHFGMRCLDVLQKAYPQDMARSNKFYSDYEARLYNKDELYQQIYMKTRISGTLCSKIFRRTLLEKSYSELPSDYITYSEDYLTMLIILKYAQNIYAIRDILYNYSYAIGISKLASGENLIKKIISAFNVQKFAKKYIHDNNLEPAVLTPFGDPCRFIISSICKLDANNFAKYFTKCANQFGILSIANAIYALNKTERSDFVASYKYFPKKFTAKRKHIGIYYWTLGFGGVETVIGVLASQLMTRGYDVTLFTDTEASFHIPIPETVRIIKLSSAIKSRDSFIEHNKELVNALKERRLDLMFYELSGRQTLLEDMIILNFFNVPVIVGKHSSFAFTFPTPSNGVNPEEIWSVAEAVRCLSPEDELNLREKGINSWYIPNPILPSAPLHKHSSIPKNIAVVGRLGDPLKRIDHCLLIFQDVLNYFPNSKLYLIGDFDNDIKREQFIAYLTGKGLDEKVILTGYQENVPIILSKCGVILSTSLTEGFPMAISEAQAMGLPCVAYDIPIVLRKNNKSIICVPQGDIRSASNAIVTLLNDPNRWRALSLIAQQACSKFSPDIYISNIIELINSFDRYSKYKFYPIEDYKTIIKYQSESLGWQT